MDAVAEGGGDGSEWVSGGISEGERWGGGGFLRWTRKGRVVSMMGVVRRKCWGIFFSFKRVVYPGERRWMRKVDDANITIFQKRQAPMLIM